MQLSLFSYSDIDFYYECQGHKVWMSQMQVMGAIQGRAQKAKY